jgi:predicted GNAT superfamily acetyltransferase
MQGGIGTDRFVVAWDLTTEGGANASAQDGDARNAPIVGATAELPDASVVRVEVPGDIDDVLVRDFAGAARLRQTTRRIFTHYMPRGYKVTGFSHLMPEDRYFYILSRNDS